MDYNKNLNALRAIIARQCDQIFSWDALLVPAQLAEWLLYHQRDAVTEALIDLICQVHKQRCDRRRVTNNNQGREATRAFGPNQEIQL
jgi:hypothetical protein